MNTLTRGVSGICATLVLTAVVGCQGTPSVHDGPAPAADERTVDAEAPMRASEARPAEIADVPRTGPIRVLFVGGDWKAQLPNYQQERPLRGHFVKKVVDEAAPGRFTFTLWTSYEFLQYGDADSLKNYDVIVVGDTMGQSVLPRLVRAVGEYVAGGGGFWYCDNHKSFMFYELERSFDHVLPIKLVPFRAYGPEANQPRAAEGKIKVVPVAVDHPILEGLDVASAPPLRGNTSNWGPGYGEVKPGATVLARTPGGKDIWVAWEKGRGRSLWTGGVFANDEFSEDFAAWPQFGRFYAQALSWLAGENEYRRVSFESATADGTLTVDPARTLPAITAKHFGIHGQEDCPGGSYPMKGKDLELYRALKLDGTFARTSSYMAIKRKPGGGRHEFLDDGGDITRFDWSKYDFSKADVVVADLKRIGAEAVFLYWCPWWGPNWPDAEKYTKYFAASIEHVNGTPGTSAYAPNLQYFEIMNEPHIGPADSVLPRYIAFYNHAASKLRARYPGVKFGCGGFNEWTYVQKIIDGCGENLDWFSRHPYGHTGEAVFFLQDQYAKHARSRGRDDLKFIVTEWDFWVYGEPAFDYLMMRWKPLCDRADSCLGSLHYRWREYQEGGYVFGIHGEFDKRYGELPPEWPNPGKDEPITYRYNAWWIVRDLRGPQCAVDLHVPELAPAVADDPAAYAKRIASPVRRSTHAYALSACDGKQFTILVNYGMPYEERASAKRYDALKLRVTAPIPPEVKGRTLVVSRADCRARTEQPPRAVRGDAIDVEIEVPAQSSVAITVR